MGAKFLTRKQSHSSPKSFFDRMIGENAQEKREEKAAAQEAASYSGILTIQPKRSGEAESHFIFWRARGFLREKRRRPQQPEWF